MTLVAVWEWVVWYEEGKERKTRDVTVTGGFCVPGVRHAFLVLQQGIVFSLY
jgi:hypothetical protein